MNSRRFLASLCLAATLTAATKRDWKHDPAIVEWDTSEDIYAVGDAHGDPDRLAGVLKGAGLIATQPAKPQDVKWSGGKTVLVVTGDMIDKGTDSLGVIALLRALQASAAKAGGKVLLLAGNHEAEFLANPASSKVQEFAAELTNAKINPAEVGQCKGDLGNFLCSLAFGARVNDWFFCHGGNTQGMSIKQLSDAIEKGVDSQGYSTPALIGDDSLLEARLGSDPWFGQGADGRSTLSKDMDALKVRHIVQGHQPGKVVFGEKVQRAKGQPFQYHGMLFLIDDGMSRGVGDSGGAALRITAKEKKAISICPDGSATEIWDHDKPGDTGSTKPCQPLVSQ